MIVERELELLILTALTNTFNSNFNIGDKEYSIDKIASRTEELILEFLEPYVIDKNSKE